MILPILEFLQEKKMYDVNSLLHAKVNLVSKTKMVDFAAEQYLALHKTESIPKEMEDLRTEVHRQLKEWQEACVPLVDVLNDAELVNELRAEGKFTLAHLQQDYKVTPQNVEHLYRLAKLNFDVGFYEPSANYLFYYRLLSNDEEKKFWALWGKLGAEILMANCEAALEDLNLLREAIDQRVFADPLEQLQQRTWLLHWSLFIFFNLPNGLARMIDLFLQEKLLSAIQTNCPHILRYLTAAVLITKRQKNLLKDIVKVIIQEQDSYSDPITEFLRVLYVEFDFTTAQQKLKECNEVLAQDFFLSEISKDFIENARLLFFETYTRIHKCVDIGVLSSYLGLSGSDAERQLVELIREIRVNAKIDSATNQLIVHRQYPNIYQQVIEKTKGLTYRSGKLAASIDKKLAAAVDEDQD